MKELSFPKKVTVVEDFGWGYCKRCGKFKDLRFGVCFDCATEEEKRRDLELLGILKRRDSK